MVELTTHNCWAILTGEYPPNVGGVSDYTRLIARGLAEAGDEVHVFAPRNEPHNLTVTADDAGVQMHWLVDHFGSEGRQQLMHELSRLPRGCRVLVQYVPQAFGYRGMNVAFCLMLRNLARAGVQIWVMFHEVMFPIDRRQSVRHNFLGLITRIMAKTVARSASQIFVTIPRWRQIVEELAPGKPITWLPVPSNMGDERHSNLAQKARESLTRGDPSIQIIGHFGSCDGWIGGMLSETLAVILGANSNRRALLIGRGSREFAAAFSAAHQTLLDRIIATGEIDGEEAAIQIAACDVLVQPYPDGVSCRRSSAIAGLALGTAIVTSSGELTEDIWQKSGAVFLAPDTLAETMIAEAERALGDKDRRAKTIARGKQLYHDRFHWQRTVDALRSSKGNAGRSRPRYCRDAGQRR